MNLPDGDGDGDCLERLVSLLLRILFSFYRPTDTQTQNGELETGSRLKSLLGSSFFLWFDLQGLPSFSFLSISLFFSFFFLTKLPSLKSYQKKNSNIDLAIDTQINKLGDLT